MEKAASHLIFNFVLPKTPFVALLKFSCYDQLGHQSANIDN